MRYIPCFARLSLALAIGLPMGSFADEVRTSSAIKATSEPLTASTQRGRDLTELAIRYEHAEGVERDYRSAHALYCSAAKIGFGEAYIRLGWMYANARGVARDDQIANTLFRRAAQMGYEMGGRLAELVRGTPEDKLPTCLIEEPTLTAQAPAPAPGPTEKEIAAAAEAARVARIADAKAQAAALVAATPVVNDPAQFSSVAPSLQRRWIVQTIVKLAAEFRLDPRLVLAIVQAESGFNVTARSNKNAQGLMQLIPDTAVRFAVNDTLDPVENLKGGMSYLRWLLSYFRGDVALVVAAYNAGEGAVDRYGGVPPFSETMAYVQRIRAIYPFDRHPYQRMSELASRAKTATP